MNPNKAHDKNCYRTAIILPTYCEAENIKKLVLAIENLEINSKIFVINDPSPDGTGDVVKNEVLSFISKNCSTKLENCNFWRKTIFDGVSEWILP